MRTLITGGAGFIGCNLAAKLARDGNEVVIVDNLSRTGSDRNLAALLEDATAGPRVEFRQMDVRDADACGVVVAETRPAAVAHLAGQVAVTDSVSDPVMDFEINARGTLNVLEAVRRNAPEARVVFTSTNKVYGTLLDLPIATTPTRYVLPDHPDGISETFPTNAATPYGCSKLTGDLYVRDFAQTYGLATTVFRMSCIYGRWQNGTVDQGWVNWLVRSAASRRPITIYGDGLQVRDLLHIDDLVDALCGALDGRCGAGQTFNVGGGPQFSLSIWAEFGAILEDLIGWAPEVKYEGVRTGDQNVYISDIRKITQQLSWRPRIEPAEGIAEMVKWIRAKDGKL
jgi:CDP-paratose 2-epimerase